MITSFRFCKKVCLIILLHNIVASEVHAEVSETNVTNTEAKKMDDWTGFAACDAAFCMKACSARKPTDGVCDSVNSQVCKCDREKFSHVILGNEGELQVANTTVPDDQVCIRYCESLGGYGRVWLKNVTTPQGFNNTKHCLCLVGQVSPNGFTLCDRHNREKCQKICHNQDANCAFNGACMCRGTWSGFFNLTEKNSRVERVEEKGECDGKCQEYNFDWVGRVYDTEAENPKPHISGDSTQFLKKYCLCGEEVFSRNLSISNKLKEEGFQICTGIKCKQRCHSVTAYCEPDNRRACYCNNQNIFIKKHLWSRLPSHEETMCQQSCNLAGLDARVIEWNPFFIPTDQRLDPFYRKTSFQYLYDGKFCHCIKIEIRLNQFRPCTDELCEFFCGHHEAVCDMKTRRGCLCNTHKLMLNTGRLPEPSERACDVTCRTNRMTGRIVDVTWKKSVAEWGGSAVNKYCACIRPVTSAGLSHCEPENDQCPKMCQNAEAYCTKDKVCQCGEVRLANNKNIRKGTLKEWDECSEKCRSWMWPLAADMDNKAWIYDCGLENSTVIKANATSDGKEENSTNKTSAEHDPEPGLYDTFQESPGQVALQVEALSSWMAPKKYCLCAKSVTIFHQPGFRGMASIEPVRVPTNKTPCINNHTCTVVKSGLEIIY